ncbi:MAG: amidohydrolase [Betaproteobacteria bacterium]|nr:amidohydrolase [Betaproteobacteria bacterium]
MTGRRKFLSDATRFGAGLAMTAALPFGPAWSAANEIADSRMIDVHHHFIPKFYVSEFEDRIVASGARRPLVAVWTSWTPERAIEAMDRSGVATSVLSLSFPGVWFGEPREAARLARRVNEYAAEVARSHPGRFGLFSALPLPDADGSLNEIAFAFDVLKADGIGLLTSYGDKWLGDAVFDPVFAELNRRKAVVFVHPVAPACCKGLIPGMPAALAEVPQDTARAIINLVFSGTFTRYPEIRFIFSHAGGTMPMLIGRMHQYGPKDILEKVPRGIEYEIRRQYFDIAGSAFRPAVAALRSLVPTSQILFGSDNPFIPLDETARGLAEMGFSADDLRAIRRDNALGLFPRLKRQAG